MKSIPAAILAVVAAALLSGCGTFQSQPPADTPQAPVVNAPAPPLPPDPALGPHARPQEEAPRRGRRQPEPPRSSW